MKSEETHMELEDLNMMLEAQELLVNMKPVSSFAVRWRTC